MQPPPLVTRKPWSTRRTVLLIIALATAGLMAVSILVAAIVGLVGALFRSSEPYQFALRTATSHPQVIAAIGEPITPGWLPNGNINIRNQHGEANFNITLKGSNGKGSVEVTATRDHGSWTYHQLIFHNHHTNHSFSLLDPAPTHHKIRVLIVDGFSNHHWQLNTQLIRDTLEPTGYFDISVSTSPPTADSPGWDTWQPDFASHDVVIQTCNDIGSGPSWPQRVKQAFESYVSNGGGVLIHHSANNAFADWEAYNQMIGLGWRKADQGTAIAVDDDGALIRIAPGDGSNTGHGPRVDATITRLGDHPIHHGLPREWRTPDLEIYHHPRGPARNLQVLSCSRDPQTGMRWPIEWTVHHGNGRVYNSTYGHVWHDDQTSPARTRCAAVQTLMVRALFWLAQRDPMPPMPDDFPAAGRMSIRPGH